VVLSNLSSTQADVIVALDAIKNAITAFEAHAEVNQASAKGKALGAGH
jgi:hypothetical protein